MKFEIGSLYKVRFYDHCTGLTESVVCEVVGWVLKQNANEIVLTHWRIDSDDKDMVDNNHEYTVILKGAMIRKRKL